MNSLVANRVPVMGRRSPLPETNIPTVIFVGLLALSPGFVGYNKSVQIPVGVLVIITIVVLLGKAFLHNVRFNGCLGFILVLRLLTLPQTIINKSGIINWGYLTISLVLLALFLCMYLKDNLRVIVDGFFYLFTAYAVINLVSIFLLSDGTVRESTVFFLGSRVDMTQFLLPWIFICAVRGVLRQKLVSAGLIFSIVISYVSATVQDVSTAVTSISLFIVAYLIGIPLSRFGKKYAYILVFLALSITVAVVFFHIQDLFKNWLATYLNRDTSLTGRTEIWRIAREMIAKSWLFGHGEVPYGNSFVFTEGRLWPAHDSILQLAYEGGLVLVLCWLSFILYSIHRSALLNSPHLLAAGSASIFSFLMAGISGGAATTRSFYFVLLFIGLAQVAKSKRSC